MTTTLESHTFRALNDLNYLPMVLETPLITVTSQHER